MTTRCARTLKYPIVRGGAATLAWLELIPLRRAFQIPVAKMARRSSGACAAQDALVACGAARCIWTCASHLVPLGRKLQALR